MYFLSNTGFCERPNPTLFQFIPQDKLKNSQILYRRVSDSHRETARGELMGILYENYNHLNIDGKQRIMLQNEAN